MLDKTGSGKQLNEEWKVGAQHALYHHTGSWYHLLERFPGALFDKEGYVIFATEAEFRNCRDLRIRKHVRAPNSISQISGYVKVRN